MILFQDEQKPAGSAAEASLVQPQISQAPPGSFENPGRGEHSGGAVGYSSQDGSGHTSKTNQDEAVRDASTSMIEENALPTRYLLFTVLSIPCHEPGGDAD